MALLTGADGWQVRGDPTRRCELERCSDAGLEASAARPIVPSGRTLPTSVEIPGLLV